MSRPPVIETEALRKEFGQTLAVAGLTLSVRAGEIFGFLGPNGAGKTTSIKMLLGLVTPTSGTGRLLGAPLGDRAARARVGFLPEHFRFHDSLTARELLRFHGRLHGLRGADLDARIDTRLARVDLVDAADRPLRGYSKGMQQRTGLAQALLHDPDLVFLDEPTSGLDPLGRLLVRDIVADECARGATIFINSHLLSEIEATCHRVAFVKQGRLVHEMALGASAPAAFELDLRIAPLTSEIATGLCGFGTDVVQSADDRVRLRVASDEVVPDIVRWLTSRDVNIYALDPRRKSLEEWFVDVMGGDQRPG